MYLDQYIETIRARGNDSLADSILKTATEVGDTYIKTFSFLDHEMGLLLGNVQSGKTAQMFGILCKATDLGFPVFVLLITDNVVLQQQTLDRVKADLKGFCICGEDDTGLFNENRLEDPTIIVLKKNARVLRLWSNVLNSTGFMKGNPLFIIDDEADAASLNTMVNEDKQSSINKYLDSIKNGASCSLYLQVTGTPQAIYLQTLASGWHPYFTYYFKPGKGYLGGNFFFPTEGVPSCISFIEKMKHPLREALIHHLVVTAQLFATGHRVCNFLIHPSVRQAVHERYAADIQTELSWCRDNEHEFFEAVQTIYNEIEPVKENKVSFTVLQENLRELLQKDAVQTYIMNGKYDVQGEDYAIGCNVIVGGNTLGRGVTFPQLQTIYYTRTAKSPQADTMWQHSRMFGYDRDAGLMQIFIDKKLYKLFADINAVNNSIISQIEHGMDSVRLYYPAGLQPTRKNVIDNRNVDIIPGGTNYYPFNVENDTIEDLTKLLSPFDNTEPYYSVSLRIFKEIFKHIVPSIDFNMDGFLSIIDMLLAEKPTAQGILIVRRNRNVAQGTGALLSPNDWSLGAQFTDKAVLTMYQVTGEKGWNGKQLWVPNIKLPDKAVYYDVKK